MSEALADLLIDLSDAETLQEFRSDPEKVMEERNLTELDRAAVRSRASGWIRHQANRVTDDAKDQAALTTGMALVVAAEVDVVIISW